MHHLRQLQLDRVPQLLARLQLIRRLVLALLWLGLFALFVARMPEPFGVDQGLFACFTRWLPRGWLPYRDLFDTKPPLFLYWWALPAALPIELHRAVWCSEGLWLAATAWVMHGFVRRLFGRTAAHAAAALLVIGLWAPGFGGFWSRAQAEELLALPMIGSAWLAVRARERERFAFGAGLLVGVCGLFKVPAMAIGVAWSIVWIASDRSLATARRIGALVAGVALPWGLAAAWFSAHGAFGAFVEAVFRLQRAYHEIIAPPWGQVLSRFSSVMLDAAPLPLCAALIGLALLLRRRSPEGLLLLAWTVFSALAVLSQRQLAGYHFLLMVPPLAIAGGYAVAVVLRARRRRAAMVVCAALLALLVFWVRGAVIAYGPGFAQLAGRGDRASYLRRLQQGGFSMSTEEEAAAWIAARTRPEEGILVFGLSPGIYALADRHPTTRHPFHKILVTEAPLSRMLPGLIERRAALVARVQSDPPAYVLVGTGDRNAFEPMDSRTSLLRFPALKAILDAGYVQEPSIGAFLVYRRR